MSKSGTHGSRASQLGSRPESEQKPLEGGGPNEPFLTAVYVGDFIMVSMQLDPSDQTALIASASLAPDNVSLFGPGEKGETSILAPKKSTDWNTNRRCAGFYNQHPHHADFRD